MCRRLPHDPHLRSKRRGRPLLCGLQGWLAGGLVLASVLPVAHGNRDFALQTDGENASHGQAIHVLADGHVARQHSHRAHPKPPEQAHLGVALKPEAAERPAEHAQPLGAKGTAELAERFAEQALLGITDQQKAAARPAVASNVDAADKQVAAQVAFLRDVVGGNFSKLREDPAKDGGGKEGPHRVAHHQDHPVRHPMDVCDRDLAARGEVCPEPCPFAAEMEKEFCRFKCVKKDECGAEGTMREATIPDDEKHECRRCDVEGCRRCKSGKPGEDIEICEECMLGYYMKDEGKECVSAGDWIFMVIGLIAVILTVLALAWYVDLRNKPIVNPQGIDEGQAHRSRTKPHQFGVPGRPLWPIDINLNTEDIAGVGTVVFFRFQTAVLIWAAVCLFTWLLFCLFVDTALFRLGIGKVATPQEFCAVIQMGRKKQMELVWTKVTWLALMYPFSFFGAMYYSVATRRLYSEMDNLHMTMSDFVLAVTGLPRKKGSEKVEEDLKSAIQDASGEQVVGVSCCWDIHDHHTEHHVKEAMEYELTELAKKRVRRMSQMPIAPEGITTDAWERTGIGAYFDWVSYRVLKQWQVDLLAPHIAEEHRDSHVREFVENLETSDFAFVVFETECARDRALEKLGEGFVVDGALLRLQEEEHEPEAIVWEHCGVTKGALYFNLFKAVIWMGVAVAAWTFVFYLPYEHYMASFSYANGDEPGEISEVIFVCLVVLAQIALFVVANTLSHHAGFLYEDNKQCTYIILYNSALIVNLVLDIGLTCILSYHQMVGRGVHNSDGRLLAELDSLQQILESYPMQKSIGNQLFRYCWPATFFLPFSAEPPMMIWLPWHIGRLFIRSHPRLRWRKAEKVLRLPIMEQGRYADLMFNAILVACIPFIAPGYMFITFGVFIFSHTYIYLYDHIRTLRACTKYHFSSDVCNKQGQYIFAIPCGMLLAALIFKVNQWQGDPEKVGSGPLQGEKLWSTMLTALVGHVLFHVFCLDYIVPFFEQVPKEPEKKPYSECAKIYPATYFSTNPIHCLRSKYIYKHNPPQSYYMVGKEHLAEKNEKIGAYFEAPPADVEDYETTSLT